MNDRYTKRIRLFKRGEPINRARDHNEPREAVNRILNGVAPPRQIGKKVPKIPQVRQFMIGFEAGDYVAGWFVSGSTIIGHVQVVAKPWMLRRTPFDGKERAGLTYTYTTIKQRSVTDGNESEEQRIVPSYEYGDIIHVLTPVLDIPTQCPVKVIGIDLNTEGRAWAKVAS